jgi:hypothetical protein
MKGSEGCHVLQLINPLSIEYIALLHLECLASLIPLGLGY